MRILIDMQGTQSDSRFRGIGRYSKAFIRHLIQAKKEHEILLAFSSAFPESLATLYPEFETIIGPENIKIWHPVTPVHYADQANTVRRIVSEQIREAFFESLRPDVVLITSLFEGFGDNVVTSVGPLSKNIPVAVILYDFIPMLYPDQYLGNERLKAWYYEKLEYLKQARLLLAISESVKNESREILDVVPANVVTISSAVESLFWTEQATAFDVVRDGYGITQPFLLYTGGSDPRKNLLRLVEAFASISKKTLMEHQLVLAGSMSKTDAKCLKQKVYKMKLHKNKVLFLGRVSDADLIGLYRASRAFILPSYHEGFGLPVLEAMACGAPVIGSNVSSIPEAVGLEEALFDPRSTSSMANSIENVLKNDSYRQRLIDHGSIHCKKFSWEAVACRGLAALESVFELRHDHSSKEKMVDVSPITESLITRISQTLVEQKGSRLDFVKAAVSLEATFKA
jgi:glycosyltransferase involved in cell wall biosynthesis